MTSHPKKPRPSMGSASASGEWQVYRMVHDSEYTRTIRDADGTVRLRVVYRMHRRGEGACKALLRVARVGHEPDDIILKRIAVFDLPRTSTSTYSTWPQSSSRIVITVVTNGNCDTRLSAMR